MPSSSSIKPKASQPLSGEYSSASPPPDMVSVPSSKDKDGTKMHRRSRAGCYTCRLRRKKCDEKRDVCSACRNLKIECHYSRPSWWANADKRRMHKDYLKERIQDTKKAEKEAMSKQQSQQQIPNINSPPSLCPSAPSSEAYSIDYAVAAAAGQTRAPSTDSHFSPHFDLDTPKDFFNSTPMMPPPQWTPMHQQYAQFHSSPYGMAPFEIDVKTEQEMFINDMPVRKETSFSTLATFHDSPFVDAQHFENWVKHDQQSGEWFSEPIVEEQPSLDSDFFEFTHSPGSPSHETQIEVDPADQYLLEHFLNTVAPIMFPILDLGRQGTAQRGAILPALESNSSYLHACLCTAALHLRATTQAATPEQEQQLTSAILDHRWMAIQELCNTLNDPAADATYPLETMLALIVYESLAAPPTEDLQNVPWHQHLAGAKDIIDRLGLLSPDQPQPTDGSHHVQFNATLACWIDVLGATMTGRVPLFAEVYRHKIETGSSTGLAELMGCDDRIMYLIAEICSLESLKRDDRLDSIQLCGHIASLGEQLSLTEMGPGEVTDVHTPTGAVHVKQLGRNVSALFRIAARIYLCSLVPGFDKSSSNTVGLLESFTSALSYIPTGHEGSIVWPLLIAGSVSSKGSALRTAFNDRFAASKPSVRVGSLGRLNELLQDVWKTNDAHIDAGLPASTFTHWREVMANKGWDILLI